MSTKNTAAAAPVVAKLVVSNSYIDSVIDQTLSGMIARVTPSNVAEIGNAHAAPCKLAVDVAADIARLAALVAGTEAAARLGKIDAKRVQRDLAYSASQRKLAFSVGADGKSVYTPRGGSSEAKLLAVADIAAATTAATSKLTGAAANRAAAKQAAKPSKRSTKS